MTHDPENFQQFTADYATSWSSGSAEEVASHFAPDGQISINRGEPIVGQNAISEMVRGFKTDFPDLALRCDYHRLAGDHAIFVWTLEGHHIETKNSVKIGGWEEWTLDDNLKIATSLGWFNAKEYDRQVAEGA